MNSTKPGEYALLSDPAVLDLFMRFPLPIVVVDASGSIEMANDSFTGRFDTAILESPVLRALAREPEQSWRPVRVAVRDGHVLDAWAQGLRVQGSVMLLVDDAATPRPAREVDLLRARIAALEKQSATDHLTGTWNRAHLDRSIAGEIARSIRLRQPVSLVLLDIDHFKRINDTWGHQAGDSVLRELVAVCTARVRKADILFRWGGEEFVILATSTGYRNAEVLAEALRKNVAEHRFDIVGSLTVSLGVAEHFEPEGAEEWFRRVDAALYEAKDGGRNRVVTDRRGDSDTWAAQSGKSALHLVWQEAYECGQPLIDRQHRELFDLANALIDASFSKHSSPQVFQDALDKLLTHIAGHFRDEEALLEQHHYAQLDAHKAAHAGLLRRAGELKIAARENQPMLGTLVEFLANDVVARHLFTADRAFFPLFGADGAAPGKGVEMRRP